MILPTVDSGALIRQARTRAGLSQTELARRTGRLQSQIVRWEAGVNQPTFETVRSLIRACGFDFSTELVPYEPEPTDDLEATAELTPQQRLQELLRRREEAS